MSDHGRLTTAHGEPPQGFGQFLLVLRRPRGREEEVTVARERRIGFTGPPSCQSTCRPFSGGIDLPQRRDVFGRFRVECRLRDDDTAPVRGQHQAAQAAESQIVVEIVEWSSGVEFRNRGHGSLVPRTRRVSSDLAERRAAERPRRSIPRVVSR